MPVKQTDGAVWDFDNRCKLINHARFYGVFDALKFPVDFSAVSESDGAEPAPDEPEEGA